MEKKQLHYYQGVIRNSVKVVAVLILVLAGLNPASPDNVLAAAKVTVCASGCDETTIADALDSVDAGGTVEIRSGTYTEHDILVDKDVTIAGDVNSPPVVQASISANQGQGRVFEIDFGVYVVISDLVIRHGDVFAYEAYGGGILNGGNLTLIRVTVSDNRVRAADGDLSFAGGGAIYSDGWLSLEGCTIEDNTIKSGDAPDELGDSLGAGIYSEGDTTVVDSVIQNNTANSGECQIPGCWPGYVIGGGICSVDGSLTVTRTTIADNQGVSVDSMAGGGGVALGNAAAEFSDSTVSGNTSTGDGGAIMVDTGGEDLVIKMKNSTISGNTGYYGGGISLGSGFFDIELRLDNCTITGNYAFDSGGGLSAEQFYTGTPVVLYKNTIIHDNTADTGNPNCYEDNGVLASQGHNLLQNGTSCNSVASDIFEASGSAGLGTLENNGGLTKTHALEGGSSALNAAELTDIEGNNVTSDQRGEVRPQDGSNDIGAYESSAGSWYKLTTLKTGGGSGWVEADSGAVICGPTCEDDYPDGRNVVLTATNSTGSTFTDWSGEGCSGTGDCTVALSQARTVTANFDLVQYLLTVTTTGDSSGTVTDDLGGIDCGIDCNNLYDSNTLVTLTAAPDAGTTFAGWSGGGCSGNGQCAVRLTEAKTVNAEFNVNQYTLTVEKDGNGTGAVAASTGAIDCGSVCSDDYDYDTQVILTATPGAGSFFSGWSGGVCSGTDPCTVTMDLAKTVNAEFTLDQFTLTVNDIGDGLGAVTSWPTGIDCGADCTEDYDYNTAVTLTASVGTESTFSGWSGGGCSGTGDCPVTMDSAKTVNAEFTLNRYQLSVTKSGKGSGVVTAGSGGIDCGGVCQDSYAYNSPVTLSAASATGSTFSGWSGAGCSGTGDCAVTVNRAKTATADFTLDQYLVTVNKTGNGGGTVTASSGDIDCGGVCQDDYDYQTQVLLNANPISGSSFSGWSGGGCSGTGACLITVDQAKTVTAEFTLIVNSLTVNKTGSGGGTVTSSFGGIDCGSACQANYDYGSQVSLSAVPESGSSFTGWTGAGCSGADGCTITLDQAKTVTAVFDESQYALTVTKAGEGRGLVSSDKGGIDCGDSCSDEYTPGEQVTLTAAPESGSSFAGWSGAGCSGAAGCTINMSQPKTVTAVFDISLFTLTVSKKGEGRGLVSSDKGDIHCGAACSDDYENGEQVTLTAAPESGSYMAGWSGSGCTGVGGCTVEMDRIRSVAAKFSPNTLTVAKEGDGDGRVRADIGAIDCGSSCQDDYDHDAQVVLTAVPGHGSYLSGWSGGGCSGDGACTVTMDQAKTVTAEFTMNQFTLSVSKTGDGEGTVTADCGFIYCGGTCQGDYECDKQVVLTAYSEVDSFFAGWSGSGCSGAGTCTVKMDQIRTVTAEFLLDQHLVVVDKTGKGDGTVSADSGDIYCGDRCYGQYDHGSQLTLTAVPDVESTFERWYGECSGYENECTINVDQAGTVGAIFTRFDLPKYVPPLLLMEE